MNLNYRTLGLNISIQFFILVFLHLFWVTKLKQLFMYLANMNAVKYIDRGEGATFFVWEVAIY